MLPPSPYPLSSRPPFSEHLLWAGPEPGSNHTPTKPHDDLTRRAPSLSSAGLFFLVIFITSYLLLNSLICLGYYPCPSLRKHKLHECRDFCLLLLKLSTQGDERAWHIVGV